MHSDGVDRVVKFEVDEQAIEHLKAQSSYDAHDDWGGVEKRECA